MPGCINFQREWRGASGQRIRIDLTRAARVPRFEVQVDGYGVADGSGRTVAEAKKKAGQWVKRKFGGRAAGPWNCYD